MWTIAKKQIDVIDIYTTDAKIDHLNLRVLKDDLGYSGVMTRCCFTGWMCRRGFRKPGRRCRR